MDDSQRNVIFWSGVLMTPSETFIRAQARAMRRFTPHFAGVRFYGPGSFLAREECTLLNGGGLAGRLGETIFKATGAAPGFCRRLARLRPGLLHAHHGVNGALALPLASALRVPLVVTFYGRDATVEWSSQRFSLTQQLFRWRTPRLQRETALFIAVSGFIKRKLVERGYPADKIIVHYYGVDTSEFRADPAVPREPVVLFVGRLDEKKGCQYLIRAMERVQAVLPRWQLVLIGDGPLMADLKAQAASVLRRCTFLGLQPPGIVRQWMNRASLLVAPSVTAASGDSEGLPTVIVEAQAMGLPVVATDHAGINEAIAQGETGLMAPERDEARLAEHILRLCSDPALWRQISAHARLQVERRFDLRDQTAAMEGLYADLIGRSRAARFFQVDRIAGAIAAGSQTSFASRDMVKGLS